MKKLILIGIANGFKPRAEGFKPGNYPPACVQATYEGEEFAAPAQGAHFTIDAKVPGTFVAERVVQAIDGSSVTVYFKASHDVLGELLKGVGAWHVNDVETIVALAG